jgi:hypothetical protein
MTLHQLVASRNKAVTAGGAQRKGNLLKALRNVFRRETSSGTVNEVPSPVLELRRRFHRHFL